MRKGLGKRCNKEPLKELGMISWEKKKKKQLKNRDADVKNGLVYRDGRRKWDELRG